MGERGRFRWMSRLVPILLGVGGCGGSLTEAHGGPAADAEPAPAERTFAALLQDVVTASGLVRYDVLAQETNRRRLESVRATYAAARLPQEPGEKLAFLCNTYNANVLVLALAHGAWPGLRSVRDICGFFDELTFTVAGRSLTLNELENEHVRPLGDPRIHAALVCAAMSCPPLRREPYRADRLQEQLDDQCRRWINDPTRNRADGSALRLSEIFNWYAGDFDVPPFRGQLGFVQAYAAPDGPIAQYLSGVREPKVRWLTYDWALNQAPPTK